MIQQAVQPVLNYGDLIPFKIEIQKFSLLSVGKTVDFGEIHIDGVAQLALNLSPVQLLLRHVAEDPVVGGDAPKILHHVGDGGELDDAGVLLLGEQPALHGPDFCSQTTVGE